MKVVTIVGARPQFIKAAVVSRAFEYNNGFSPKQIQEVIVHTGQHYDTNMSEIFFAEMRIPKPQYQLAVHGGTHGGMTAHMLEKIEQVLITEKPDLVLVYGDTNSTLAGALAAAKLHIPVAHVEAGLRSFDMNMPEEINRILTDRISQWLLCPTQTAVQHLFDEGFNSMSGLQTHVCNVGDVMYDAVLYYKQIAQPSEKVTRLYHSIKNKFYLMTVHRAENTDDHGRLYEILAALEEIARYKPVIWPVHPRTRQLLEQKNKRLKSIICIDPVGYFDMLTLLEQCNGVFTDSGGLQKEAYFFGKQCVTMRDQTEWTELVQQGCNVLTGASYQKILDAEKKIYDGSRGMFAAKLYGDGHAGEKIVNILLAK